MDHSRHFPLCRTETSCYRETAAEFTSQHHPKKIGRSITFCSFLKEEMRGCLTHKRRRLKTTNET